MVKKSRYGITLFQLDILEAIENTQEITPEAIQQKLNTTVSVSEISMNIRTLQSRGYVSYNNVLTEKARRTIEEYYSSLSEESCDEGFDSDPGICDLCKEEVENRILFKKEHLCRNCLNP